MFIPHVVSMEILHSISIYLYKFAATHWYHVHCTSPIQEPSRHARRMVKRRIVRFRIVRKRFWERKRNQKFPTGLLPKRPEAESMDDVMSCQDLENPKEEEVPLAWHTCTSLPQNGCIKLNLAKKKLTAKKIPDFATWQSFSKCKTIHPIDLAIPSQKETRKAKEAVGWVPLSMLDKTIIIADSLPCGIDSVDTHVYADMEKIGRAIF